MFEKIVTTVKANPEIVKKAGIVLGVGAAVLAVYLLTKDVPAELIENVGEVMTNVVSE